MEETLELLVVNLTVRVRKVSLRAREYLVAPSTLIVPGVLNGSIGPLYYPPDEVSRNYDAWNAIPIVVNHPRDKDGNFISARDPSVLEQYGIGHVYKSVFNGKLQAELWFDVQDTIRVDKRIYDWLLSSHPIRLSTGLFTKNEKAVDNSVFNSPSGPKPYTHVARHYRPDHLAILPDSPAACDLQDGCGVLVNQKGEIVDNCGGEGSGRPGPCPTGRHTSHPSVEAHKNAAIAAREGPHGGDWEVVKRFLPPIKTPIFHTTKAAIQIVEQGVQAGKGSVFGQGNVGSVSMSSNLDWTTKGQGGRFGRYVFVFDEADLEKHGDIKDYQASDTDDYEFERRFHGDKIPSSMIKALVVTKHMGKSEKEEAAEWPIPVIYKDKDKGWTPIQRVTGNQGGDMDKDQMTLLSRFLQWLTGNQSTSNVSVSGKDPSYDPEHPEECCPNCGARLERDPDSGKCNKCGADWPLPTSNEECTCKIENAASDTLDMTPEKACKILKDGEVHGKPLTDAQRGMFGAKCKERRTNNSGEELPTHTGTGDCEACMNREELKNWLTANCDCWKGAKAREALNTLTDTELTQLKKDAETAQRNAAIATNAAKEFTHNGTTFVFNEGKGWEPKKVNVPIAPPVQATLNDLLNAADPDTKAAWGMLQQFQINKKAELINLITANRQGDDKAIRQQALQSKSLPQLEEIWADMQTIAPRQTNNQQTTSQPLIPLSLMAPNYGLAGGAPNTLNTLNQASMNDVVIPKEINWKELAGVKD